MGQVIAFPAKPRTSPVVTAERHTAFVTGLCALTYLLGFFIVGPSLAIFAFGFVSTSHVASAAMCVAGLLVCWPITRYAYKRL